MTGNVMAKREFPSPLFEPRHKFWISMTVGSWIGNTWNQNL